MNLAALIRRRMLAYLDLEHSCPTALTGRERVIDLIERLQPVKGGFEMRRMGPVGDGGYLVPDDLAGIEACFSPGVGTLSGFELDCANLGMNVFLADRSVEGPAGMHHRFSFTPKHVGALDSEDCITMNDWVEASLPKSSGDLLLQIDIEGSEYETLLNISPALMRRFRIIVVEFHHLGNLWSLPFYRLASRVFDKMTQHHACVHIHPNNHEGVTVRGDISIPQVMEFTFLRRDRIKDYSAASEFPHKLDNQNNNELAPLDLPGGWYGQAK